MKRQQLIAKLRAKLAKGACSIGSWIQLSDSSVAEIMGESGYDWIGVDLEHGAIGIEQLPDLFRALELGGTIPLARVAEGSSKDCKRALDAGAAGVIVPMVESAKHLQYIVSVSCWPPVGTRGVGFSRANLFGKHFDSYAEEARSPFVVAMIETSAGLENLEDIVNVAGLDALLIGPYDLSASMGCTAQFEKAEFKQSLKHILTVADNASIPCGVHVVKPSITELKQCIEMGYRFIPYSIDTVFLSKNSECPIISNVSSS